MEPQLRNTPPAGGEHMPFAPLGLPHMNQLNPPLMPFLPPTAAPSMPPTGFVAGQATRDCVRLRGLPFEASVTDILSFLGDFSRSIVFQGVHMVYNSAVSYYFSISMYVFFLKMKRSFNILFVLHILCIHLGHTIWRGLHSDGFRSSG